MMSPIRRAIEKALAPVRMRVRTLVQRAVLSSLSDTDGVQIVTVQVLGDHMRAAEHFQPAGLTARPTAGTGVALAVGSNSDHMVLLGLANRDHRPTELAPGETALYSEQDPLVLLAADGTVIIGESYANKAAALAVAIAQKVETELNALRTTLNTHTHVYNPGPGAPVATATGLPQAAAINSTASANVKAKV